VIKCNCPIPAKDIQTETTPEDGDILVWNEATGAWDAAPPPEPPELPDNLVYRDSGSVWATTQLVQAEGNDPYTLGAAPCRVSGEFFEIENTGANGSKITLTGDVTLPQPGVGDASETPGPGLVPKADVSGHLGWEWLPMGEGVVVKGQNDPWTLGYLLESQATSFPPNVPPGYAAAPSPLRVTGDPFVIENTGAVGSKITLTGDVTLPEPTPTVYDAILVNGWTNYNTFWQECRYWKTGGMVWLFGMIGNGNNYEFMNLPTGFRPARAVILPVVTEPGDSSCHLRVYTHGVCWIYHWDKNQYNWVSFGVCFPVF
jgi:hypothetical protein